jgi:hypothetical protein
MNRSAREPASSAAPLRRLLVGVVIPLGLVVFGVIPALASLDRLPDPVATHWGPSGAPNGSMSTSVFLATVLLTTIVPGLIMFAISRRAHPHRFEIAPALGFLAAFAAVWVGVSLLVVEANVGVADWRQAATTGAAQVGLVLGLGLGAGAMAFASAIGIEQPRTDPEPNRAGAAPSAGLGPNERAAWVGHCRSRWAWPTAIGFGGLGLVGVVVGLSVGPVAWWTSAVLLLVALSVVPFTSIRVTADRRGLRIELGPAGWPTVKVPIDAIVAAHVEADAIPTQWGGWGYRGSLKVMGKAAVVLRRGPAIRLEVTGGRAFLVTVDDPRPGAGILNDLRVGSP